MKKTLTWFSVMLLACNFLVAQDLSKASDYMSAMGNEFKAIQAASWDYTKSAANNKSARKINKRRLELVQQIEASKRAVSKLPTFNKNSALKDTVISFLDIHKHVINEDYAKIMDLEDVAESSYDAMEALFKAREIASQKLEVAGDRVDEAYKAFAKENNVTLVDGQEDKITKQLKIADEVYEHHNQIYLLFFKAYKQEFYFMDALNKGDIAAMEQNKASLVTVSEECLEKLKSIKAFRGTDNSMLKAAIDMITFYKLESTTKLSKLIEFHTKKEAFDKGKKAFEANKDKSNDDINNYNKLINEYNEASNEYNKVNNELNNSRNNFLNNWNKTSQSFTAKYL